MLGSYIFKPKYDAKISEKIINGFLNDFCNYEHNGFYAHWYTVMKDLPPGYVQFGIETDNGDMEQFSEMCYEDEPITASQMTNDMYVLLGDDFWYKDDDGHTLYSFEERELGELVSCLAAAGSRVISTSGDAHYTFVREAGPDGSPIHGWNRVNTINFLLEAPLKGTASAADKQLTLPLA